MNHLRLVIRFLVGFFVGSIWQLTVTSPVNPQSATIYTNVLLWEIVSSLLIALICAITGLLIPPYQEEGAWAHRIVHASTAVVGGMTGSIMIMVLGYLHLIH